MKNTQIWPVADGFDRVILNHPGTVYHGYVPGKLQETSGSQARPLRLATRYRKFDDVDLCCRRLYFLLRVVYLGAEPRLWIAFFVAGYQAGEAV